MNFIALFCQILKNIFLYFYFFSSELRIGINLFIILQIYTPIGLKLLYLLHVIYISQCAFFLTIVLTDISLQVINIDLKSL